VSDGVGGLRDFYCYYQYGTHTVVFLLSIGDTHTHTHTHTYWTVRLSYPTKVSDGVGGLRDFQCYDQYGTHTVVFLLSIGDTHRLDCQVVLPDEGG
jgi:hypothetical protein